MSERKSDQDKPLADRRAEAGAPQEIDDDFASEHTPSPTDPPIAEEADTGGQDHGYSPQTEVPD
ncbi:hypothetical protein ACN3XK_60985 [Actinomadura welshii]